MGFLRLLARAIAIVVQALIGVSIVLLVFPFCSQARRDAISAGYLRVLFRVCGVRARVHGVPLTAGQGELVVSNHVSWLDVLVLNALGPIGFVSKSEVRDWPVIGFLAARSGTIFIERGRRRAVHGVIETIVARLVSKRRCAVFAEGTTTDGSLVLPFHSNLLKAALMAAVPIRPVCLLYCQHGVPSEVPAYFGDMSLIDSLLLVLPASGITVDIVVLPAIESAPGETRHQLADRTQVVIAAKHAELLRAPVTRS